MLTQLWQGMCYEHAVKHIFSMAWSFSVFRLRLTVAHSRDQPAPSRLEVSWLAGQDHETWWVMRHMTCVVQFTVQNELRSHWGKNGIFCRSNCTRYEPTSLTAVAAWTPACSVGSARRRLVLWSTVAVLIPSHSRCTALGSLPTYVGHHASCLSRSGRRLLPFLLVLAYP